MQEKNISLNGIPGNDGSPTHIHIVFSVQKSLDNDVILIQHYLTLHFNIYLLNAISKSFGPNLQPMGEMNRLSILDQTPSYI